MKRISRSSPVLFVIALFVMAGVITLHIRSLPPQIPLLYSQPQGDEQITDFIFIFVLPLMGISFIILNNLLTKRFFNNSSFIKQIVYFVNIGLVVAFTYIFVKIIFLIA